MWSLEAPLLAKSTNGAGLRFQVAYSDLYARRITDEQGQQRETAEFLRWQCRKTPDPKGPSSYIVDTQGPK